MCSLKKLEKKYKFWRNWSYIYLANNILFQYAFYFLIFYCQETYFKSLSHKNPRDYDEFSFMYQNWEIIVSLICLKLWIAAINGISLLIIMFKDNMYDDGNLFIPLFISIFCSIIASWIAFIYYLKQGEIGIYTKTKQEIEKKKFSFDIEQKESIKRWK